MNLYLAGKITDTSWRAAFFSDSDFLTPDDGLWKESEGFPIIQNAIHSECGEVFDYVGPFFRDPFGSHAASTDEETHGMFDADEGTATLSAIFRMDYDDDSGHSVVAADPWTVRRRAAGECIRAISTASVLFAWIDRRDIYGTLVEIGYAISRGCEVWIGWASDDLRKELWFVDALAYWNATADDPKSAFEECATERVPWLLRRMPYEEYLRTTHWASVRAMALDFAAGHCQVCYSGDRLEVHHRTYDHRGFEQKHPADVTVLCHSCHETYHKPVNGKPTRMPGRAA